MVSLHFLYPDGDLTISTTQMSQILSDAGINYEGVWNIQEYGSPDQQIPSGAAWNIAQLERHNAPGLRANWRGGLELHDYLANLLGKAHHDPDYSVNDTDYWGAREYPVYIYYHKQMVGQRVRTEMTSNTLSDTFAVIASHDHTVRILAGSRPENGSWNIQVNTLSAVGLPPSGSIDVLTLRFNSAEGIYDAVDGPESIGTTSVSYSDDTLTLEVTQTDSAVAFAYEFSYTNA